MDAQETLKAVFGLEACSDPLELRARSALLALLIVHDEERLTIPQLAGRICAVEGDIPVEQAIVDFDRAGVTTMEGPYVRATDAVRALRDEILPEVASRPPAA